MNTTSKLIFILISCITFTACAPTTSLNKESANREKIETVYLNTLSENISIKLPNSAAQAFKQIKESTNVMSSNKILKNALAHSLEGNAFSQNLIIDSDFGKEAIQSTPLTPILTPSVIMSENYSVVNVRLSVAPKQKSIANIYSSEQRIDNGALTNKEAKQYWIDNPVALREKIVNGLYDVAKQFADDSNK